ERLVDWARTAKPGDFARLAPLVFAQARQRDPLAIELVGAAASEIARIGQRLLELGAPSLAMIGGLAEAMLPWLPAHFRVRLAAPEADAMDGAIVLARRACAAAEAGEKTRLRRFGR